MLGTFTKSSTVNAALKEIVGRRRRQDLLDRLAEGGLETEDHDELRMRAWQREVDLTLPALSHRHAAGGLSSCCPRELRKFGPLSGLRLL
ncbi:MULTISPECIES: hypothetical protein [Glycomyces]|uniref:Uncharacterized protein n=1 Tax=Glycomyces lechevalierae TaxID=256034 RepID=A0A9X3PJY6_9ACTN|nr:hypothetical protein [Glycomyces lechevalierae]MDA1385008.1 hypothetical protein [Glycomyces lechevalierae]